MSTETTNRKWIQFASTMALALVLGACGGGGGNHPSTFLGGPNGYTDGIYGGCTKPTVGTFNRTVIGTAENSVILQLDLIDMPDKTVAGIGTLNIPSVELLDGGNTDLSAYMQSYASIINGAPVAANNTANTQYQVCVSSVGSSGTLTNGSVQYLTLNLRGPGGLVIQMSSTSAKNGSGFAPYVQNNVLFGQAYLALPGREKNSLTFAPEDN